ncbi:MAG: ferritin family protein [Desulfobacterales bacterium]
MQSGFQTFAEVLAFAAQREEDARRFYLELARQTTDTFMKQIFMDFAHEEEKHRQTLENLEAEGLERIFANIIKPINDLALAENAPEASLEKDPDFRDALLLAMKREDKSHRLYSMLAENSEDHAMSLLFIGLAKEEAHHKLRIERAYKALYGD